MVKPISKLRPHLTDDIRRHKPALLAARLEQQDRSAETRFAQRLLHLRPAGTNSIRGNHRMQPAISAKIKRDTNVERCRPRATRRMSSRHEFECLALVGP